MCDLPLLIGLVLAAETLCNGACKTFADRARALCVALGIMLVAMGVTTALMFPTLVLPFGGSVAAGILAGLMIASAIAFTVLVDALRSLELCQTRANSVTSTVALVASVIGIAFALVVGGATFPGPGTGVQPCTGSNC